MDAALDSRLYVHPFMLLGTRMHHLSLCTWLRICSSEDVLRFDQYFHRIKQIVPPDKRRPTR